MVLRWSGIGSRPLALGLLAAFSYLALSAAAVSAGMTNAGTRTPADGERFHGVVFSGIPDAMHRVVISLETLPGENEREQLRDLGGRIRHLFRLVPAVCIHLPERALHALARRPGIVRIENDGRVRIADELSASWGVERIRSGMAHARNVTGAGIRVAVLDTGVDYTHSDLSPNYAGGFDFVNNDSDPMDDHGHGTLVAGILAAVYDGSGVVGVAPEVEMYALKVLDHEGNGYWSDVIAALEWAVEHGIQVTNNSYGTDFTADSNQPEPIALRDAFDAAEAAGVLHVAAAGNSGDPAGAGDTVIYPARFASLIAVAATDGQNRRADFSATGPAIELSAPGVAITSTAVGGGYQTAGGTSLSSPHAAGAAALVIAAGIADVNGNGRANDEVRSILASSADDLGASGRDHLHGWGLVNAARAAVPCSGDIEPDGDVDGIDLAAFILNPASAAWAKFSANLGRTECP